ncbi:MAG: hypothetical protein H0U57_09805 [Tatlockia sp.]|nr:hypothetical protein [Tatlockia sp.]
MNEDILRYKFRFITFVLLLGYAFIHIQLTGIYSEVSLSGFMDFSLRLPYGQRLLVPALLNLLKPFFPIEIEILFFSMEFLFTSLFFFALFQLLQQDFSQREAKLLSWFFILLLPLITVVNYRLSRTGLATFFYPYDTATLFFMTMGYLFCLREQWIYLILWVFLATLNRESALLLVLIIPALHWQHVQNVLKPTCYALLAFILGRALILGLVNGKSGQFLELSLPNGRNTLFADNLFWLLNEQNLLLFIFCFAGLCLFWFAFYDFIPIKYRPLRYVALVYFIGLAIVGRFMEARIFSEVVLLLYLPVCVAIKNWLVNLAPIQPLKTGAAYYIDRYAVLGLLIAMVILFKPLNNFFR